MLPNQNEDRAEWKSRQIETACACCLCALNDLSFRRQQKEFSLFSFSQWMESLERVLTRQKRTNEQSLTQSVSHRHLMLRCRPPLSPAKSEEWAKVFLARRICGSISPLKIQTRLRHCIRASPHNQLPSHETSIKRGFHIRRLHRRGIGVKKYPKFADKQYINIADRGWGMGQKIKKKVVVIYGSPQTVKFNCHYS